MKRFLCALLILSLIPLIPLPAAAARALPADLQEWMATTQQNYLYSDPNAPKPVVPVSGWPVYWGGDWSYQYPPDWTVLGGDVYSFTACDSRRLACFDYCQVQRFDQPYTHDMIGGMVFSRIAGDSSPEVVDTFQKNILPNLMLTPPEGVMQVWFISWQHPEAGRMFTLMEVTMLAWTNFAGYGIPGMSGGASASWTTYTAPEAEFTAMWANAFNPMRLSATYTIPGGYERESDTDGDGYPDSRDSYPYDPNYH